MLGIFGFNVFGKILSCVVINDGKMGRKFYPELYDDLGIAGKIIPFFPIREIFSCFPESCHVIPL